MKQFEVGKVYKAMRDNTYLKVTKRTDKRIYSTFVSQNDGSEYDLDFKFRNIEVWNDVEHVYFPIGIGGKGYSAEDEVSNFEEIVANNVAAAAERKKKLEEDTAKEAQRMLDFLREKGITFDFLMHCGNIISETRTQAMKLVAKEVGSKYFEE